MLSPDLSEPCEDSSEQEPESDSTETEHHTSVRDTLARNGVNHKQDEVLKAPTV